MQEPGPGTTGASQPSGSPGGLDAPTHRVAIDPPQGRRIGRKPALVAGIAGLVLITATAAFGYASDQDLAMTRARLSTTTSELASTTDTLATTTSTLEETSATLAVASTKRETLETEVTEMSTQVETQIDCAARQSAALVELGRISSLQTDNFNRTAGKSTWAKADDAHDKAITAALDAYYRAYSKAFNGSRTAARADAVKGADALTRIKAAKKTKAAEQKLVDAAAGDIEKVLDALEAQLVTLGSTCQEVTR